METMFFSSSQVFPQKHGFSTVFWGYVQYMRSTPYFWRRIQAEKIQKKSIVSIPEPTVFFLWACVIYVKWIIANTGDELLMISCNKIITLFLENFDYNFNIYHSNCKIFNEFMYCRVII